MVVFEDGLARKSEYRRFQIKGFEGQDDVRSMHEVIGRRFRRYLQEKERTGEWEETPAPTGPSRTRELGPAGPWPLSRRPAEPPAPGEPASDGTAPGQPAPVSRRPGRSRPGPDPALVREEPREDDGRPKRFAYPPQLVVVDGGQPQVAAAKRALDELGIDDVAVCGLAKRLEEVWLPDDDDPVVLPRSSEGLYLLQRVRDEAHRFAITYQRAKRAKRIRSSPLDDVPGLGETRKQALIKHFGSVKRLRQATIERDLRGAGDRPQDGGVGGRRPRRGRPGRTRREHRHWRDH